MKTKKKERERDRGDRDSVRDEYSTALSEGSDRTVNKAGREQSRGKGKHAVCSTVSLYLYAHDIHVCHGG